MLSCHQELRFAYIPVRKSISDITMFYFLKKNYIYICYGFIEIDLPKLLYLHLKEGFSQIKISKKLGSLYRYSI